LNINTDHTNVHNLIYWRIGKKR